VGQLVRIDIMAANHLCLKKGKAATWLDADMKMHLKDNWLLKQDPPEECCTSATELDITEMALAAFEPSWRLLAPRAVVVPPAWVSFAVGETREPSRDNWWAATTKVQACLSRAELLLAPCWGDSPPHWTLLVLERTGMTQPAEHDLNPAQPGLEAASVGCVSCKWTRCGSCCPEVAENKKLRKAQEWNCLDPLTHLHPLEAQPGAVENPWVIRYYDSLHAEHPGCQQTALDLLKCLGLPFATLPASASKQKQKDGTSCGFWAAYFLEEELKRRLGCAPWSWHCNLRALATKVQMMKSALA
jgi:hypothetical protein